MALRINRTWVIIGILVVACLIGMTWLNLVLFSEHFSSNSAFLLPYTAVKAFFTEGTSPYDESLISRTQSISAQEKSTETAGNPGRFVYPLFAVFLYAPFTWMNDPLLAFGAWMTFLECCVIGAAAAVWRLLEWRAAPPVLAMFFFFSLTSFYIVQPLVRGNIVLAVNCLFLAGLVALHYHFDEIGAICLACSTIKPYLMLLPILFLLIWLVFQHRLRFIIWFFSILAILVFLSVSLQPDWIIQNLREAYRLFEDNQLTLLMTSLLPEKSETAFRFTYLIMGGMGFLLLTEWMLARRGDFHRFLWVMSVTLVVNQILLMENNPGNLALLYLPVAMILTSMGNRLGKDGSVLTQFLMAAVLLVPWFFQVWRVLRQAGDLNLIWQMPALAQISALWILALGLYWVRWWIIHPVQFSLERE